MSEIKYTEHHEWIKQEGNEITVGITDHAQQQLGDVVFVELPEVDTEYASGDEAVVIESVKAAGDISLPVTCTVTAVNDALSDDPELINNDAMGEGWIFKATLADGESLAELMSEEAYQALIAE
ncbi:glycine cleavage system protein GcvH [Maricurvus nonylphenolicus]|uniref:glycine cleavage system protein GcvH n=1 Tax=Maricurvus nonylphenolicus TaxID=1008307 RepID=UPI0036F42282